MEVHEATGVFPMMDDEGLGRLADDIRANGLIEPIAVHDGKVLDGRARLAACGTAGVEPRFMDAPIGGMRPIEFVLARNLRRRHLTKVQLALLAFDLRPHYQAAAIERQKAGRAGLSEEQERDRGQTVEKVAELVGVGEKTVRMVIAISRKDPRVLELMRHGAYRSVREAALVTGVWVERHGRGHEPRIPVPLFESNGDEKDRWDVVMPQVGGYIRHWIGRSYAQLPPAEVERRLTELGAIQRGLERIRQQLRESRSGAVR